MTSEQSELANPPKDGITNLSWIDDQFLLVSSWDKELRVYDTVNGGVRNFETRSPILDCSVASNDSSLLLFDGGLRSVDIRSAQVNEIGSHQSSIKSVAWIPSHNICASGGWDGKLNVWDLNNKFKNNNNLIASTNLPGKVFSMSAVGTKLVVATSERNILIFDIRNFQTPLQTRESSLKFQTRCVRCFPDESGFVVSSVEGRVAVEYFDPSDEVQSRKYAFKCHRVSQNGVDTVYPVNSIAFNTKYSTFASGGCDGIVNIWDSKNRKRLAQFPKYPTSISSMSFSPNSQKLAIASSYTFEEGLRDHPPEQIFIRTIADLEIRPKHLQK